MDIIVFGSINMDLVVSTPHLPTPGETIIGSKFQTIPGGKGANQAVACARLGVSTELIGRVGADAFGEILKSNLSSDGVMGDSIYTDPLTPSGVALIAIDHSGENTIIVAPGANSKVDEKELARLDHSLQVGKILLLQLELPLDQVLSAARLAKSHGATVILDPAPAQALPEELYTLVDVLTPNQSEAAILAGKTVRSQAEAEDAAKILISRGVKQVLVKLGAHGVIAASQEGLKAYPAIQVKAVDTVAAGDAFNGGFAAAIAEGGSFEEAIRWGIAAGAYAVTKPGAQPSMPNRKALQNMLKNFHHKHHNVLD